MKRAPATVQANASTSPPWAATASVLLALLALALNANADAASRFGDGAKVFSIRALTPILLSVLGILGSLLFKQRLERGQSAIWMVRAFVFAGMFLYALATTDHIRSFYYMNFVARIFSLSFVFEAAIQHWQRPPPGQPRNAILVFLAAIIFVLASRTFVTSFIKYLTPPFITLLVISARSSRPRFERSGSTFGPWIAALFMATILGGMGSVLVSNHSNELTHILLSLLKPTNFNEFSDVNSRPTLNKTFNLPLSQKRVFRVEGEMVEHHMRGMTFETYSTTGAWSPVIDTFLSESAAATLKAHPGGQRMKITPLIDSLPVLYVPLHMEGVDAKAYRLAWSSDWGGAIYATSITGENDAYEIATVDADHKGPMTRTMSPKVQARCLALPMELDPRIDEIAHQLDFGPGTPKDKIEAVRKYLFRNHSYSLSIEPGLGDPVANFLLQKKDGHCQFFASAAVLLLRSLGVPSRYVTGYYAHESPDPGVTIVRQRDAHAWAEVWIDGEGWQTFDATPSSGMPTQSVGVTWWARLWEKLGDGAEIFSAWLRESSLSALTLMVCGAFLFGYGVYWILTRRSQARKKRLSVHYSGAGPEFEELAESFDAWLKRKGMPCPPQLPWLEHLLSLKAVTAGSVEDARLIAPKDLEAAEAFARTYLKARFGGKADVQTALELKQHLKRIS